MTQDEIIEMARQAGGMFSELPMMDAWVFGDKSLEAFSKLVAQHAQAEERKACFYLVKNYIKETDDMVARGCLASVAYDIKVRGQA
jgi:hypothetical protein